MGAGVAMMAALQTVTLAREEAQMLVPVEQAAAAVTGARQAQQVTQEPRATTVQELAARLAAQQDLRSRTLVL